MRQPAFRPVLSCVLALPLLLAAGCRPAPTPDVPAPAPDAVPPSADAAAPPAPPDTASARFRCGDMLVSARFDNTAGQVTLSTGLRQVQLPQAMAASGARYADAAGNEFWNKGDQASLTLDGATSGCRVTDDVSPWDEARDRGVRFRGLGTEPFWSLEVGEGEPPEIALALDMGERELVVAGAGPLASGEGFAGHADDGSPVTLRITRGDCSDGMSDQVYPAAVELGVGDQVYRGCGAFLQE
ncbi:MliC family protein [Luteimonas kalidii]|uniref:MliC family protein n=1 Tax=Luteimonas kalidii TaxID=3042025 RepID=A0ABT6JP67_9GAMM|nr:MliC family protein [Luteimonas kalidii]MDH5832480.1 MliC family protein [Luteimonas kalidii]